MGANSSITDKHLRTLVKDNIGCVECGSGVQERFGFMKEICYLPAGELIETCEYIDKTKGESRWAEKTAEDRIFNNYLYLGDKGRNK